MTDKFDLDFEIERYTSRITRDIFSHKQRKRVKEEYAEHMTDLITEYQLGGMTEEEAFEKARAEFGDENKIQALLAVVHNKDRLPSWVRRLFLALFAAAVAVSWYLIDNDTYRSWLSLIFTLAVVVGAVYVGIWTFRFGRGVFIRYTSYKKLKKYVQSNNLKLIKNANVYGSLFHKTVIPELIIETAKTRYIINLWATLKGRKTLHLWENGLYLYSHNFGYYFLFTQHGYFFPSNWWAFLPNGMQYFPVYFSDMVELPRGMHLIPKIDWEECESSDKENVRVVMLNPIPFCVKNNRGEKLGDDSVFLDRRIFSASGFISYLEGLRISGEKKRK